jgi:hypothetical protein
VATNDVEEQEESAGTSNSTGSTERRQADESTRTRFQRFFEGPGQLFSFLLLLFLVVGGLFKRYGVDTLPERWTLGSIFGMVLTSFVYYLLERDPSGGTDFWMNLIRSSFSPLFLVLGFFLFLVTLTNPFYHLFEGVFASFLYIIYDFQASRVARDKRGNLDHDEMRRFKRQLNYVDIPQFAGVFGITLYLPVAVYLQGFSTSVMEDFVAGAFAFQVLYASVVLAVLKFMSGDERHNEPKGTSASSQPGN